MIAFGSQGMDFVFNPTVTALYPLSLDYLARYNIKSADPVTNAILKMNYSIGVLAFRLQSFVSCVICVGTYGYAFIHKPVLRKSHKMHLILHEHYIFSHV